MTGPELLAVTMPFLAALLGVWTALALGRTTAEPTKEEELHNGGYVRRQIWFQVGVGVVLAAGVLVALFSGCASNLYVSEFCSAVEKSPPWALVSGLAAAPALIMLWRWRTVQRAKDQQQRDRELDQHERELKQQDQVAISSRFADAVRLLSGEGFDRLGGVIALEKVANDAPETYRSLVINALCKYVRKYKPEGTAEPNETPYEVQEAALAAVRVRGEGDEVLDFSGAFLNGVDFTNAKLSGASFNEARLKKARFNGANLERADLGRATASGAWFSRANLQEAALYDAVLSGANLSTANLGVADLTGADLRQARLYGTNLKGAMLSQIKYENAFFSGATYDSHTYLPDAPFDAVRLGLKEQ